MNIDSIMRIDDRPRAVRKPPARAKPKRSGLKFRNSTDFSDRFLRRMLAWIRKQYRTPIKLRDIAFTKYSGAYRGTAWYHGRIIVRIGTADVTTWTAWYSINGERCDVPTIRAALTPPQRKELAAKETLEVDGVTYAYGTESETKPRYPMDCSYPNRVHTPKIECQDRIEALVHVTAHEVAHLVRWADGARKNREAAVDGMTVPILAAFRANREALLADWNEAPPATIKMTKPKASLVEKREAAARAMLKKWEAKAKLAKTKVTKYKAAVKGYERRAAARGSNNVAGE